MPFKDPIKNMLEDGTYKFTENGVDLFAITVIKPESEYVICGVSGAERFPTFNEAMFLADKFWDKEDQVLVPVDREIPESFMLKMIHVKS